MKELTVEARPESIPRIIEFVDGELDGLGCPVKTKTQIDIAIDELCSNIARYAYDGESGKMTVMVEGDSAPGTVSISLYYRVVVF